MLKCVLFRLLFIAATLVSAVPANAETAFVCSMSNPTDPANTTRLNKFEVDGNILTESTFLGASYGDALWHFKIVADNPIGLIAISTETDTAVWSDTIEIDKQRSIATEYFGATTQHGVTYLHGDCRPD